MKKRLKDTLLPPAFCGIAGGIYYIWLQLTGIGIPCLFYLWTGLKCPGCGITRMCLAILSGDLSAAKKENILLFYLLPLLGAWWMIRQTYYLTIGRMMRGRFLNGLAWCVVVLLMLFGIYRNIVGC
jgi:hypothetical protein